LGPKSTNSVCVGIQGQ